MSLLVWLPMREDLSNLGSMSNITVINNGATYSSSMGKYGNGCYYFDGNSKFLQLSDAIGSFYNNDFTVSAWLRPEDPTRGVILGNYPNGSSINLELYSSYRPLIYWAGSSSRAETPNTLARYVWSHLTFRKTTNKVDIFIDGVLATSFSKSFPNKNASVAFRIGDDYRGGTDVSFMGYMNDLRLYDEYLSDDDIYNLFKSTDSYDWGINFKSTGIISVKSDIIEGDIARLTKHHGIEATNFIEY